jgi:hypothetical protein
MFISLSHVFFVSMAVHCCFATTPGVVLAACLVCADNPFIHVPCRIDEVHTLVGAGAVGRGGSAGSGLDISNMLKPALARGELQVIGATTLDEHRK